MDIDYNALVEKNDCLKAYWRDGRYNISDNTAIILLNKCILWEYYGIKIPEISVKPNNLFPRVPGRACYVKFINDGLLKSLELLKNGLSGTKSPATTILDVGTGAYAVYALLLTHICKGKLDRIIGTDIDMDSLKNASAIVAANNLSHLVTMKYEEGKANAFQCLKEIRGEAIITMCNPPFYSSFEEFQRLREEKSNSEVMLPLNGTANELVTNGGEVVFVTKLIDDSVAIDRKNQQWIWFTSLLSRFSSLQPLIRHMKVDLNIRDYYVQALKIGQTTRWILCWNFQDLKLNISDKNSKLKKVQSYYTTVIPFHLTRPKTVKDIEHIIAQKTNGRLQTYLKNSMELSLITEVGDCWSRKYRRKNYNNPEHLIIHQFLLIQSLEGQTELMWIQGSNFQLFQSLHGFLSRLYLL